MESTPGRQSAGHTFCESNSYEQCKFRAICVDILHEQVTHTGLRVSRKRGLFVSGMQTQCALNTQAFTSTQSPQYVSAGDTQNYTAVYSVHYGNKGCMVDALASRSDEGRAMAAISFGEVPNNL